MPRPTSRADNWRAATACPTGLRTRAPRTLRTHKAPTRPRCRLWGAILGHGNLIYHAAGWQEGGLTASFEKLILDVEMLQLMIEFLKPIVVDEQELGFEAIKGVPDGRSLLRRAAHHGALRACLLSPAGLELAELRELADRGRQGRDAARDRDMEACARGVSSSRPSTRRSSRRSTPTSQRGGPRSAAASPEGGSSVRAASAAALDYNSHPRYAICRIQGEHSQEYFHDSAKHRRPDRLDAMGLPWVGGLHRAVRMECSTAALWPPIRPPPRPAGVRRAMRRRLSPRDST